MKTLSREIWESFIRVHGSLFGGLGLTLTVILMFFAPNQKVAVGWLTLTLVLLILPLAVFVDLAIRAHASARKELPAVRSAHEPKAP